jgi:protein-disulfide isomerase
MKIAPLFTVAALFSTVWAAAGSTGGKAIGNPSAPITIDLYSDYQCPACKYLHDTTLGPLIRDYVKTGKVYLIRHYFPLPIHQYAMVAANYACAAARIGKYEQVSDALFLKQNEWAASGDVERVVASVLTPAEVRKVRELANSHEVAHEIQQDIILGQAANVTGTPQLIVSYRSKKYPLSPGPVSYDLLRGLLDGLLAK